MYGLPSAAGGPYPADEARDDGDRDQVRRHRQKRRGYPDVEHPQDTLERPAKPKSSAAPRAPKGRQRPKIIAARATKPSPAVISAENSPMSRS